MHLPYIEEQRLRRQIEVQPLAEFKGTMQRQVGSNSLPEVQDFVGAFLYAGKLDCPVPSAMAAHSDTQQRLRRSRPIAQRPGWGTTEYGALVRQSDADQLVQMGLPLRREAIRATPVSRLQHVVRPGFNERGQASVVRAAVLAAQDEVARLAVRNDRAERTRRKLRRTRDEHLQRELRLPVPRAKADNAERRTHVAYQAAFSRANIEGQNEFQRDVAAFERMRGVVHTRGSELGGDDLGGGGGVSSRGGGGGGGADAGGARARLRPDLV
jgi:hypothetical protein